jgi:HD-GYP domain-containing protein (c-di-GMP phosphodiesterase class II)
MFTPVYNHTHGSLHELIQFQPRDLSQHSNSAARLARDLAEAAGLSTLEQELVYLGSLLHDIGKQFIPAAILGKQGKLSSGEFSRLQQHPWLGYAYLNNFVSDPVILHTVLYHHERWNGTGYPYGLEGEQIPLGARICALADVWDALISDRCYRRAWSLDQVMDLIWTGAGSLFDPQLASQFLTVIEAHYCYGDHEETSEAPTIPATSWNGLVLEDIPSIDSRGRMPVP